MQGLLPYIVRRLLWAPVILLAVSFIAFAIVRFGPGDPIRVAQGQYSDPAALARVRHTEGLDKPFFEQYAIYLKNLAHGKLGESYIYRNRDVAEVIFPKVWMSAQLGLVALLIIFVIGVPVGRLRRLSQGNWTDPFSISVFLFFQSVPVADYRARHAAAVHAQAALAARLRLGRHLRQTHHHAGAGDLAAGNRRRGPPDPRDDALRAPGGLRAHRPRERAERVHGDPPPRRAQLAPAARHRHRHLPGDAGGRRLLRRDLLGVPGIGQFAFKAVKSRDYNVILALALILAVAFIIANIVIDIAYTLIDPRVRYERQKFG